MAIQRGPLVYCLEEADNGAPITSLELAEEPNLTEYAVQNLLGGCVIVEGDGVMTDPASWSDVKPYRPYTKQRNAVRFKSIPYYLWGKRQPGEMSVWLQS